MYEQITHLLDTLNAMDKGVSLSVQRRGGEWTAKVYDRNSPTPLFDPATGNCQLVGKGRKLNEALDALNDRCTI